MWIVVEVVEVVEVDIVVIAGSGAGNVVDVEAMVEPLVDVVWICSCTQPDARINAASRGIKNFCMDRNEVYQDISL